MLILLVILYTITTNITPAKVSFKCVAYPMPQFNYVITIDLTFDCNRYNINKGCLKSVSVTYTPSNNKKNSTSPYTATLPKIAFNTGFSFSNIDIVNLTIKNKNKNNERKIQMKNYRPKRMTIGIPVLGNIFHKFPIIGTKYMFDEDIFVDPIKVKALTSFILLNYEMDGYNIKNITIKAKDYYLLYCREITGDNNKKKTLNIDEEAREVLAKGINENIKKFTMLPIDTKQHAIILNEDFIERNKEILKTKGINHVNEVGVLSCENCSFTLLILYCKLHGLTGVGSVIDSKMYLTNYSKNLAAEFKLKKLDKMGRIILKKK